ncbi:MAG TPA: glycerophosphodiester phosphodiesterase [Methylibium sp.]|uniref:glycerophosphodiester phosphodiesterase n=1 Tax=Methylibium sp. TaxID=2067992 RepID=UPI002DB9D42B|nr:glycerophosphodiester phosphodiesterase [Methylibium sp.]HEU4459761.1 glycerophosphodiester phosphodiesterase [Methylibium sp.]
MRIFTAMLAALAVAGGLNVVDHTAHAHGWRDGDRGPRPAAEAPLVIGHRGASGYLPEHTLESYALAIELGADFIEPDLVSTKDGHLIARHEPNITHTTDVASRPEFASRRRSGWLVDGAAESGFFASDFTLAEIKTLRARQPFAERPQQFNGKFEIPTFDEVVRLAQRKGRELGRTVGVYPETKHPTYHRALGLPLEEKLLQVLTRHGWNYREAPVFIQSFEQGNLVALNKMTRVRLVQLIDANDVRPDGSLDFTAPYDRPYDWTASGRPELLARTFAYLTTDEGLKEVRRYADGIGPWKRYIVSTAATSPPGTAPGEAALKTLPPSDLIQRAHKAGLLVHAYTFRNEAARLAGSYAGNPVNEVLQFFALGLDGVFTDFPDTAVAARVLHRLSSDPAYAECLTREERRGCER